MEINEQENTQEVQQENLLDGSQSVQAMQEGNELPIAVQLVQPQAALDEIAELEKKYPDLLGIEILPYHNFGKNKADNIGDKYEVNVKMPDDEEIEKWLIKFRELGCKKVFRKK